MVQLPLLRKFNPNSLTERRRLIRIMKPKELLRSKKKPIELLVVSLVKEEFTERSV